MADRFSALAVDCGATSARLVLGALEPDGKLTMEEVHRWPNEMADVDGELHWDFQKLTSEIEAGIARAWDAGHRPHSIGIDTWGVDYLLLDDDGKPVESPVAYRDSRTEGVDARVFESCIAQEKLYGITGIANMFFNTLYQLVADRSNGKERLQKAGTMLFMPNALAWHLGARPCAEYTIASTSQMLDAKTRNWSDEIIERVGLRREIFPEIVEPGTPIGTYTKDGNALQIIATAGHDTASAVAAMPAEAGRPWAYISTGTWLLVGVESRKPVLTEEARQAKLTNEGGIDGTYRLLTNVTGLWLIEEAMRMWRSKGQDVEITEVVKEAEAAPAGGPLVHPNDPTFNAPADMLIALDGFYGATGQKLPNSRGALARSIFESLALKNAQVLENIASLTGEPPEVVHMVGGGSRNHLLCQWTANACGKPVVAGPVECTATGNILIQAMAAGRLDSVAALRRIVRQNTDLVRYEPQESSYWQARREQFAKLVEAGVA